MGRSPCCEKAHTNKGAWTKEEDQRLVNYIRSHGEGCWRSLPKAAGRTDNEIKNYWNTHIKRKLISRGLDPQTHRPLNAAATTSISTTQNICLDFRNTSVAASPSSLNNQNPTTNYSFSPEETKCSSGTTEERHELLDLPMATEKCSGEVMINLELSIGLPLQAMVAQRRPVVAATEMVKKAMCLCWQSGSQSGQQ
ncbi:hypothetical protein RND71_028285 [Anisodus tanguticus]|uniref:Uncharacterized protein n=1 Tax=Anisodus tanguticus TaxID=243964 RepID=A0AAE1RKT3_9SOLA|nr:hypothetical protein RND71_028285 [Anisodus tanguticus]